MSRKYTQKKLTDLFPQLDKSNLNKSSSIDNKKDAPIETIDYLLDSLTIEKESVTHIDTLIRNYIYITSTARKHLLEIEEQIKEIGQHANTIKDKESYALRKLIYFKKINENAKNEIIKFLCYRINEYLIEHHDENYDLTNREHDNKQLVLYTPPYDYSINHQYYNPNYDFSTYVKFCNISNTNLLDSLKNVNNVILLKRNDPEAYYKEVIRTVDDNCLLQKMANRIKDNYHFHKRKEIFETMVKLFNEEKYTTFVITATIQIEGMFFELVTIQYGNKENQGTLIEKADKTFSKSSQKKLTLYPHFAFDVPELRNKVAHIGWIDDDNIKNLAYELVLDLHCIFTLAEEESLDKFKYIMQIFTNSTSIKPADYAEVNEYYKKVAEHLYYQLYALYPWLDDFFWGLLTNPTDYNEELDYYHLHTPQQPNKEDKRYISIKNIVLFYSKMVRQDFFWEIVLEHCDDFSEINHTTLTDAGVFTEKLKNMFISRLDGDAKDLCIEVNKKLQSKNVIK